MSAAWPRIATRAHALARPRFAVPFAVGVLGFAFLKLGSEVAERETHAFDTRILLALRTTPDDPCGPAWFEAAVMHLSGLGSIAVTVLVAVIATGYALLARRPRLAALIAACAAGTSLLMTALKAWYGRARPSIVTHLDPPGGLSFPSGHSMVGTALYLTLAVIVARSQPEVRLRRYTLAIGVVLAAMIGVSRIYLGVHYPTDVVAGWTAGAICALLCSAIVHVSATDVPP